MGDGSFQMTGVEVSTILKYNLNVSVIIINNDGYTTERIIEGKFQRKFTKFIEIFSDFFQIFGNF